MRQIGTLADETLAERFVDYLTTRNISATSEADHEGWIVWVRDEDQLDVAREEFQQFVANPHDETYREVQRQAAELRIEEIKKRRDAKKNLVQMGGQWNAPLSKRAPLAMAIIIACIGVFVLGGFGRDPSNPIVRKLMFADLSNPLVRGGDGLYNIRSGEVWRLLTPIFLHGHLLHLIFNMAWIYYLGSQAEAKLGKWRFAGMVVATGVASNVLQYAMEGPAFLGMSGVVFGIFGFIWMRMKHDPASGYRMSRQTVVIVLIFFAIGFAGMPMIAKWAHAGGLGSGVILGLMPEWISPKRRSA